MIPRLASSILFRTYTDRNDGVVWMAMVMLEVMEEWQEKKNQVFRKVQGFEIRGQERRY